MAEARCPTKRQRDSIQVAYFHKLYARLKDLPPYERFAAAIVLSSDDAFEKALEQRSYKVMEYLKKYYGKRKSKDSTDGEEE